MRKQILALSMTVLAGIIAAPRSASAVIIDLNPPGGFFQVFGQSFGGATIVIDSVNRTGQYTNWISLGLPQFNANGSNPTVAQVTPGIAQIEVGGLNLTHWDFTSIGLASATNNNTGGNVVFSFTHKDGSINSSLVTLAPGISGLQTFAFYEANLTRVTFFSLNSDNLVQFDNIGVNVEFVPGPVVGAGLPGLALAFGGFIACWRRARASSLRKTLQI